MAKAEHSMPSPPISHTDLVAFANAACEKAFGSAASYDHELTEQWNRDIISTILLEITKTDESNTRRYKFAVTSTIVQHIGTPSSTWTGPPMNDNVSPKIENGANGLSSTSQAPSLGRRGIHSSTGAFWDNATDGIWTFKWEGAEARGFDVIISIAYVLA